MSIIEPQTRLDELVYSDPVRTQILGLIHEHQKLSLLASYGVPPRRRMLFAGPSGTGKTRAAEAIASELGVPLARVKLAAVVSSYLGDTARHLEHILEFASHGSWVLVFDEVDMIGAERDSADHGEIKRVVATFLQTLEDYHSDNLVIATTNHGTALDEALWRRFDDIITFARPTQVQRERLIALKLRRMETTVNRREAAASMRGFSQADVEAACLAAMRATLLAGQTTVSTAQLVGSARARVSRLKVAGKSVT